MRLRVSLRAWTVDYCLQNIAIPQSTLCVHETMWLPGRAAQLSGSRMVRKHNLQMYSIIKIYRTTSNQTLIHTYIAITINCSYEIQALNHASAKQTAVVVVTQQHTT